MWLTCLFLIFVVVFAFIRSRFWVRQPVRHWWNWPQRHKVAGLPPEKYVNHAHVESFWYEEERKDVVEYLQHQTNGVYFPDPQHVAAYFSGAYVSVFKKQEVYEGCIASRPVELRLDGRRYRGYFHEFMASDKDAVSRDLVSTHEWNRSKHTPDSPSVFFSPVPLFWIVPLCVYDVRWVQTRLYRKYPMVGCALVKATERNAHEIVTFWKDHPFQFQMVPTIHQLMSWIHAKVVSVYYVVGGGAILAMFFFKKTLMVERNKGVVDVCGAMVSHKGIEVAHAFSTLLHRVRRTTPIVRLHMVGHVPWMPLRPCFKQTKAYYYAYMYRGRYAKPTDCFIL
jgi:hypothetical protein